MSRRSGSGWVKILVILMFISIRPSCLQAAAEEFVACHRCHLRQEITAEPVSAWAKMVSGHQLAVEPCPGRRFIKREVFLTEMRLIELRGSATGQALAALDGIQAKFHELLSRPITENASLAAQLGDIRRRLQVDVLEPTLNGERQRVTYWLWGLGLLGGVILIFLTLRRRLALEGYNRLYLAKLDQSAVKYLSPDHSAPGSPMDRAKIKNESRTFQGPK